jgi:uncharacterized protein YbjT (DUF2867 family)
MKTVVIFGGSGFVGRHIIRRLAKNDYKIIVPHQRQINEAKLRLLGTTGQIIPINFRSLKENKIINLIIKADVIINLKTMWDEDKTTFKIGILDFNIDLVEIIKKNIKINQYIYFSGIGIDQKTDSNRSKAIYKSEKYIQKNLKNAVIVRPGVIIGEESQFLKELVPLFKKSFFIPLFGDGLIKFQPIFIDDVSLGINKIIETNLKNNHLFEFVGPNIFTYKDFYSYLAACLKKTRVLVPIPFRFIKTGISILKKTPFSPLNLEQLKLFETDNISLNNYKNLSYFDINPQDLKEIVKSIIIKNL